MFENGYIKLHRSLLKWEWYKNTNVKVVFLHCLLMANFEPGKFEGIDVPPGSFVTSYKNIADQTGLSVHQVRVALNHLNVTHEVAQSSTSKFTVITVNNWDRFQNVAQYVANKWQTDDKQVANKWQTSGNNIRKKRKKEEKEIYTSAEVADFDSEEDDGFFESWIINDQGKREFIDMKTIETEDEILYMDRMGRVYINDYDKGYVLKDE